MFDFIYDLLFGPPKFDAILALGPLALAGISAGASLLGGIASGLSNRRVQQQVPQALLDQIDSLSNRNFFLPLAQRLIQNDQGFMNIERSLAARGIDSSSIASEQRQALEAQRQQAVTDTVRQLEGTRINALNSALAQQNQINARNAQLEQQFVNNRTGIISQAVSGIGGSIVQGFGAQNAADLNAQTLEAIRNSGNNNFLDTLSTPPTSMFNTSNINTGSFSGRPLGLRPGGTLDNSIAPIPNFNTGAFGGLGGFGTRSGIFGGLRPPTGFGNNGAGLNPFGFGTISGLGIGG